MVEYLNDLKITPSDCAPKLPHLVEEDDTTLQQIMLAFGLINDRMEESNRLHKKPKLEQANDIINNHSKVLSEEWKVMKFDHFSKETPHGIKTALEEEHKELLASNDKLIEQRLLFEEENNNIRFFLGDDEDIV